MCVDGRRPGSGPGSARRARLLAFLLALILPTATATTTTVTTLPAAVALATAGTSYVDTATATVARTAGHQQANGPADHAGTDARGEVPDGATVRVVKKVRGVLVPDGVIRPTFTPAAAPASPRPVLLPDLPVPASAVSISSHPRRGPPAAGEHPSP